MRIVARTKGPIVSVAPRSRAPFPVEAAVYEEDTFLVLSAGGAVREPAVPLLRVTHSAYFATETALGTVIVREGRPLRLLAVVYNLAEQPISRVEWVEKAVRGVLDVVEERGLRSVGLPFLGAVHGGIHEDESNRILRQAAAARPPGRLDRMWIVTSSRPDE